MPQATPNRPPRPLTGGQVSALLRAIKGRNETVAVEGGNAWDSLDITNIQCLVMDAAKDVNNNIASGVSS